MIAKQPYGSLRDPFSIGSYTCPRQRHKAQGEAGAGPGVLGSGQVHASEIGFVNRLAMFLGKGGAAFGDIVPEGATVSYHGLGGWGGRRRCGGIEYTGNQTMSHGGPGAQSDAFGQRGHQMGSLARNRTLGRSWDRRRVSAFLLRGLERAGHRKSCKDTI